MTLRFPDVSSYQNGLRIQAGTPALIAKATQGTTYQDPCFHDFMDQAAGVGAIRSGYHFIEQGNVPAQAAYCAAFVGDQLRSEVPMMIDCEPTGNSRPTISDCLTFVEHYPGRVWGLYLPRWYYNQIGGDLRPLRDKGVCLISSDYSGYTDDPSGAGWQAYGGVTPSVWQSTDHYAYGGKLVDSNAFKGDSIALHELILGDDMTPHDVWAFRGNNGDGNGPDAPDVHQSLLSTRVDVAALKVHVFGDEEKQIEGLSAKLDRIIAKIGA